ncbi:MAG: DUF99 family protein [Candidatus Nanoarchaeia archaeon]|nr:DUF99 family protein [Candidatus Nanoarchaeia archaeon]
MKKEIRVLGIDDGPFDKFNDSEALVVGTVYRGGSFIDGVLSCKVKVDGEDSTEKIIEMINKSKFKPQIQAVLLDGIAVAGFNVVDVKELNEKTNIPVIVVMRTYPEIDKMKDALVKVGHKDKIKLLENAGEIHKLDEIFIQYIGLSLKEAEEIIDITSTHSLIPEPLRVAHLIARGVVEGESKGRA